MGSGVANAVKDWNNLDAREKVISGSILSSVVECAGRCTIQHSLEHAMSAYHQELPHGAGLIMISKAYFTYLIDRHICDDRFVRTARAMGIEDAKEPMNFITMLMKL